MFKNIRYTLIFLLCLTLTACGFHLRGKVDVPPLLKKVYIDSSTPYAPFEQALRQTLISSKIDVVDDSSHASAIIKLENTNVQQSVGSISADNSTRDYTLTLSVGYQIILPDGTVVYGSSVSTNRTFTASVNQMLASNSQAQGLEADMYHETVYLMTSQISSEDARKAMVKAEKSQAKKTSKKANTSTKTTP
tara:strand:- start:51466 stop:52041 length:576 start_codon:yes stop_codon:yes gene_type:complete